MKTFKAFLILLAFSLCAVFFVMLDSGTFQLLLQIDSNPSDKLMSDFYRSVSNAFFAVGTCVSCVGVLSLAHQGGLSQKIWQGIKKMFARFNGDIMTSRNKVIVEYNKVIREKQTNLSFVLFAGLLLDVFAFLAYLAYLKYC